MESQDPNSLIGMEILNQYRLTRVLAKGGMSQVYLADQLSMDRQAAVKIMGPQSLHGGDWDLRFKREARTASRLQHPNIVTVFNFGELDDGSLFLAMEYVNGVRLGSAIRQAPLPLVRVVNIAAQTAAALEYAHGSGVVHRDLKPDNIMLTEISGMDHIKILDFGIAHVVGEGTLTSDGALMGTPRYMSPEQTRGDPGTVLSDQYALGLIIYEMITGQPAINADTPIGFLHAQQTHAPPLPSSFCAVAEARLLDPIVGRMLAKRPADRYPDMTEVRRAVEEVRVELSGRGFDLHPSALPLCRGAVDEGDISISSLPMAITQSFFRPAMRPAVQIRSTDPQPRAISSAARTVLRRRGFNLVKNDGVEADLWLVSSDWPPAPPPDALELAQEQVLYWVDRRLDSLACTPDPLPLNLLLGPAPYEPAVLSFALNWLYRSPRSLNVGMLAQQKVHSVQVTSSARRSVHVDQLVQDVRREGVRQATQQALAELCEELLANTFFHAPVDKTRRPRFADADRACDLVLAPDEAPTLAWAILNRYIAVSIQDPFGSLTRRHLLECLLGAWPVRSRESVADRKSAGLGLRIAARAARHLICAIVPGTVTEILALVPKQPAQDVPSLCVLEASQPRRRLGRNLWLKQTSEGEVNRLQLVGEVMDAADLGALFHLDGEVRLDLSGILRFSSRGIHLWLAAMEQRPPGQRLVLECCSLAVVSQLNSVPGMIEGVELRSVLAPYFCSVCGLDSIEMVTTEEALAGLPPARQCVCGAPLTFDGIVDQHFAFLETVRRNRA